MLYLRIIENLRQGIDRGKRDVLGLEPHHPMIAGHGFGRFLEFVAQFDVVRNTVLALGETRVRSEIRALERVLDALPEFRGR